MFDYNTFKDKRHLLILVAITLPSKDLKFCKFTVWLITQHWVKDLFQRNCPCAFKDKKYLLISVAVTQPCKELQLCNFIIWQITQK